MTVKEINEERLKRGYSYKQLAELSGVPVATVQKVLSGTTKHPRYLTIRALSDVFDEHLSTYTYEPLIKDRAALYVQETAVKYGASRPKQGEFTIEDLEKLPDDFRYELIDGVLYDMGAPTTLHQSIVSELMVALRSYVKFKGGPCKVFVSPIGLKLDEDNKTYLEPDVLIVCHPERIKKKMIYGAPDFVAEVLSPSTKTKDTTTKLLKYKQAGVREYWIIYPDEKMVLSYDLENDGIPRLYSENDMASLRIYHDECKIDLKEIFDDSFITEDKSHDDEAWKLHKSE